MENAHRHDPQKLAAALLRILDERQAQQVPVAVRTA